MNARTAAKMFAVAALTVVATAATGCMAPVEGSGTESGEATGQTSEAATRNYSLLPATMNCSTGGSLVGQTDFRAQLYAAGCTANVAWISEGGGTTGVQNRYEIECPTSATTLVNSMANTSPWYTTIHSTSSTVCENPGYNGYTIVPAVTAPLGWMFVEYDPTGCHCT